MDENSMLEFERILARVNGSETRPDEQNHAFVRAVFLPNCQLVGPKHSLTMENNSWIVHDASDYDDTEINDEEFSGLRTEKIMNERYPSPR